MIVVADTSPINYLIRLNLTDLLLHLYGQVLLPTEVLKELQNARAPAEVKKWAENLPHWISVQTPQLSLRAELDGLDAGERAAIELACEARADILLLDERKARRVAESLFGLTVFGTLGVLRSAHQAQLIDGVVTFEKLCVLTNFYQNNEMRSAYMRSLTE
jgi:predicted nucleic acid-binding protein